MSFQPQMKPEHAAAFQEAARLYKVYILVRRTNLRSLAYVGDPRCVPKRLDCKAKTADRDYTHPRHGRKAVAGLVVDPTITGREAFASADKFAKAEYEWGKFAKEMLDAAATSFEGQRRLTYLPNGKLYFVDLDPASPRFGCLKFSSSSLLSAGKYIHGDFDLYGIVPEENPALNIAVMEQRLEQRHARSPEFFDVQHYINRRLGVTMVLHGAQEGYADAHSDEGIDVFHPDGTMTGCENAAEIRRLYDQVFRGRKLFTKGGPRVTVRGMFVAPG